MTIKTRAELKALFESGDEPTQQDFIDLIDSFCHMSEALPAVSGSAVTGISPSEWTPVVETPTYASTTTFTVPGDLTGTFLTTRRVRATLTPGGTVTSAVRLATYSGGPDETTVEIGDAVLTANLTAVDVSLVTPFDEAGSVSFRMLGPLTAATIAGLALSNNGAAPYYDIDIAPGYARDAADSDDIDLAAALTKSLDSVWAPGDGGGLLVGVRAASTCYAVWLIKRTDTGVVDVGFDPSFTAPTLPANYDKKRLIGFVTTNSTAGGRIRSFLQKGDYFVFTDVPTLYVINQSPAVNATIYNAVLPLPPLSLAEIHLAYTNTTATDFFGFAVRAAPTGAINTTLSGGMRVRSETVAMSGLSANVSVLLDANASFDYAAYYSSGSASVSGLSLSCQMLSRSSP